MNVLEQLYYGNINPTEQTVERNSEYGACMTIIAKNEMKLIKYLALQADSEEMQQLFSQLMDAQRDMLGFSECNRFIEGFHLGSRFMVDTFVVPQKSVVRDIN